MQDTAKNKDTSLKANTFQTIIGSSGKCDQLFG